MLTFKNVVNMNAKELRKYTIMIYENCEFPKKSIKPPPISTINKIIKRNNLILKKIRYNSKSVNCPYLKIKESNLLHQFDLIGKII